MNEYSQPWTVEDVRRIIGDAPGGNSIAIFPAQALVDAHESAIAQLRESLRQSQEKLERAMHQIAVEAETNAKLGAIYQGQRATSSVQVQAARKALERCRQRAWTIGETWPEVEAVLQYEMSEPDETDHEKTITAGN